MRKYEKFDARYGFFTSLFLGGYASSPYSPPTLKFEERDEVNTKMNGNWAL